MKKNTGISYEILVQRILEQIQNQNAVQTTKIERDVTLTGKTTTHQIDLLWRFKRGGIEYLTIVQVKDWKTPVKKEQLAAFKYVLDDLPNQPRGVFVTRTGYQKGAKETAEKHGIILYELREPTDKDWEGRIKVFIINQHFLFNRHQDVMPIFDSDWFGEQPEVSQMTEEQSTSLQTDLCITNLFYDQEDSVVTSIEEIAASLCPIEQKDFPPTRKVYTFTQPTFAHTNKDFFPRIKVKALELTVSVDKVTEEIQIKGEYSGPQNQDKKTGS